LRRELVRDRPARLARAKSEIALAGEARDLVDDAVDLERQRVTSGLHALIERREPLAPLHDLPIVVDGKAESSERREETRLRVGNGETLGFTERVREEMQGPLGRDGRIELAYRPRGGVARVDEK